MGAERLKWPSAAFLGAAALLLGLASAPPPLTLRLTLPYAATAPGGDLVVFAVLRNGGREPVAVPSVSVRMETAVEGRPVVLLVGPFPPQGTAGSAPPLAPGESRAFRLAVPLDRRLFLPGRYPLVVRLASDHGPALTAEASFTVRYTKVFYY